MPAFSLLKFKVEVHLHPNSPGPQACRTFPGNIKVISKKDAKNFKEYLTFITRPPNYSSRGSHLTLSLIEAIHSKPLIPCSLNRLAIYPEKLLIQSIVAV